MAGQNHIAVARAVDELSVIVGNVADYFAGVDFRLDAVFFTVVVGYYVSVALVY